VGYSCGASPEVRAECAAGDASLAGGLDLTEAVADSKGGNLHRGGRCGKSRAPGPGELLRDCGRGGPTAQVRSCGFDGGVAAVLVLGARVDLPHPGRDLVESVSLVRCVPGPSR